jgi:predicted RNase H-like HicB family nuclease
MTIVARVNNYTVVVQPDEDGGYAASVPVLPGCFSQGGTIRETIDNAAEAIAVHLAGLEADDDPIPADGPTVLYMLGPS